ncbi:MAG: guanylate kinase [Deltaproteobacteria bacterium RIFCSPHIGHO2_02_FULL_40_11]|nr:MAG: guanylate kinase [Deltaproteobacteria bacterium RIFCSPHIGHO2_02_FULL_40_11]
MSSKGKLFIISAPSGAGKTTLCQKVLKQVKDIQASISYTTRPPRPNEIQGKDYFFVTETQFEHMEENGDFIEAANVHGALYGQSKRFIESTLSKGIHVLANVDIQGAKTLKKKFPDAVTIFIHPPSFEELKKRLVDRKSDTQETISKRLKIAELELKEASHYEFEIVNDDLERAVNDLIKIIGIHAGDSKK